MEVKLVSLVDPDTNQEGERSSASEAGGTREHLFFIFNCERPLAPSFRCCLSDLDRVFLGRGAQQEFSSGDAKRSLHVDIPDAWMSSRHATLAKVAGRWVLTDNNSSNGSLVNGSRITRVVLSDGDVVQLGHSFYLFRDTVRAFPDGPVVFDSSTQVPVAPGLFSIIPELDRHFSAIGRVAHSRLPLLIQGETGTGKEVIARAIHLISGRKGDFVAVNCGALTPNLIQTELFGYKKGAFSGATEDRTGLIRSAQGGTLFFDEVGDFPPDAQVGILRALEQNEVTPVGGTRPVSVDVRYCAATHRPIEELVRKGRFREDLFARLNGFLVRLPPLRERREDLGLIIAAILQRNASVRPESVRFTLKAASALIHAPWPRNIRELEKTLEGALILAAGKPVSLKHLPGMAEAGEAKETVEVPDKPSPSSVGLPNVSEDRKEKLEALLAAHEGNVSAVARALGKARVQIRRWLKLYALDPEQFRKQ